MIIYGISANEHDASLAVARDNDILFASSSERYSRRKNDPHLCPELLEDARRYGEADLVVWYERPFLKRMRKLWAGQHDGVLRADGRTYLRRLGFTAPVRYVGHHHSHAAAGFFTSGFDDAAILVADAIGEWDTLTAWLGRGRSIRKLFGQSYPHSLGLLYSAFTQRVGLKPNEEEYVAMGMAAYGRPVYRDLIWQDFIAHFEPPRLILRESVHRGIRWWRPELQDRENIAASIQKVTEEIMIGLVRWLGRTTRSRRLVLMGGVALNCVANTQIAGHCDLDDIWIMPNPGDAGSSLGAIAAYSRRHLNWTHPYLGHDIDRPLEMEGVLSALKESKVAGIANGRAEFGPRALGNRSILADPRDPLVKDRVNGIKGREPFRPFAPVILAEQAHLHFEMPVRSTPYMQFVAPVRHPDLFPAIAHRDGTARLQTVTKAQNPNLYTLLQRFHVRTGCPMLLNTSLNVKGEPMVNSWLDARRFAAKSGVSVF